MKFKKKPIEIEAVQWNGDNKSAREVSEFMGAKNMELETDEYEVRLENGTCRIGNLYIKTSEGLMLANFGDWIIKESFDKERKFYPCKKDVFEQTYELVD